MAIEEKDEDAQALEFTLQIQNLSDSVQTSFFQVQRRFDETEYELVYESNFQNPLGPTITFDVASILIKKLTTTDDNGNANCDLRIQLFSLSDKTVFDRSTSVL